MVLFMTPTSTKPSKSGGRPRIATTEERAEIRRLYYEVDLTAKQIQDLKFPHIKEKTLREIARLEAKRATPEGSSPMFDQPNSGD